MLALFLYFLFVFRLVNGCSWPSVDALFILDGSLNVNQYEHQNEVAFIKKSLSSMVIHESMSRVSVAQFTPRAKYEIGLADTDSNAAAELRLQQIIYQPCDVTSPRSNCSPMASMNSIARYSLSTGNRKQIPDVIVVISSSRLKIPEVNDRETLLSPISPIHTFHIVVSGSSAQSDHFEPSANTIRMTAVDFTALLQLVEPLCQSVNSFVGTGNNSIFGPLCWTVTGILAAILLVLLFIFCYAIYRYREENESLKYRISQSEKTLRSQNEYFTAKLHSQMEDHIKSGQKHAEDLGKQQEIMKAQQDELARHLQHAATPLPQPQPIIIPFYPQREKEKENAVSEQPGRRLAVDGKDGEIQLRFDGDQVEVSNGRVSTRLTNDDKRDPSSVTLQLSTKKPHGGILEELNRERLRIDHLDETINGSRRHHGPMTSRRDHDGKGEHHISKLELGESNASKFWRSEDPRWVSPSPSSSSSSPSESLSSSPPPPRGHLPLDHPARSLPPIDILFLVDSSSSIGITNFDAIKVNICALLDDMDISPGRSRVALIQYAQEPSVVFGFEKYYSVENVKKGVNRMSYTGGATMLAKALSFAAGILYKEQNMKEGTRKHKLMPTPRHDRLQILCVVCDGASDDSIDKAASNIHDKLQVKVMAMVSKSFNKDKLLAITRFDGSVFVMTQKESMSIWLWRQQKLWAENYGSFIEKEKSMPLSTKRSPKKAHR